MDISLDSVSDINLIVSYDDKQIVIRNAHGQSVAVPAKHLILTPRDYLTDPPVDLMTPQGSALITEWAPQVLLYVSHHDYFLSSQIIADLAQKGIGLEPMRLGPACRTFNLLVLEGREVMLIIAET